MWGSLFTSCLRGDGPPGTDKPIFAPTNDEELYSFQSGRWLWDEQKQLDKRSRKFDAIALQEIAIKSVGAKRCISMSKISEVGANKVFRLLMDNRNPVIAKIPHRRTECGSLRVASEVATMDFASTILGIPVPKVLAWDAKDDAPVNSEYILMEEASGTLLDTTWTTQHPDTKVKVFDQLALIAAKFQSVSFSSIGNIYFTADNIPRASPAIANGSLTPDLRLKIQQRYAIGPTPIPSYWTEGRAEIAGVQGPWHDAKEWLKAIATREIAWLEKYAPERTQTPLLSRPKGTREEHIDLWKKFEAATDFLNGIKPELLRPTLWHADLSSTSIFVKKKNKITTIIDWELSGVSPLLFAVERPALLKPRLDMLLEMPTQQQFAAASTDAEKAQLMDSVEYHYLRYAWETVLQHSSPTFVELEAVPLVSTMRQLVVQAQDTWTAGSVPLRGCLITLHDHWDKIRPGESCPYTFTQEELNTHAQEDRSFRSTIMVLAATRDRITGEGFVKHKDFEGTMQLFGLVREMALEMLEGDERDDIAGALAWTITT